MQPQPYPQVTHFEPSRTFYIEIPGYYFGSGEFGTGYYRDKDAKSYHVGDNGEAPTEMLGPADLAEKIDEVR